MNLDDFLSRWRHAEGASRPSAASPVPLSGAEVGERFTGKCPRKKRLPLATLVAPGLARRREDGRFGGNA